MLEVRGRSKSLEAGPAASPSCFRIARWFHIRTAGGLCCTCADSCWFLLWLMLVVDFKLELHSRFPDVHTRYGFSNVRCCLGFLADKKFGSNCLCIAPNLSPNWCYDLCENPVLTAIRGSLREMCSCTIAKNVHARIRLPSTSYSMEQLSNVSSQPVPQSPMMNFN